MAMAVRKSGMRRIVVDGVEYLWKFPRRPSHFDWDCWGGCAALVQRPDRRGSVLCVRFPQHHPGVAAAVGFPVVSVLPSQIADAIRRAVVAGWQADEPGPAFGIDGLLAEGDQAAAPDRGSK
jgi:hypothetical protein